MLRVSLDRSVPDVSVLAWSGVEASARHPAATVGRDALTSSGPLLWRDGLRRVEATAGGASPHRHAGERDRGGPETRRAEAKGECCGSCAQWRPQAWCKVQHQGVPVTRQDAPGRYSGASLHQRWLQAETWLGDSGARTGVHRGASRCGQHDARPLFAVGLVCALRA